MEDWSDTPIYAQMMAEKQEREMLEAERVENPIWAQVVEETNRKKKLMNNWQKLVVDMREAMDLPNSPTPRTLSPDEAKLHIKMIRDEFEEEFVPAFLEQDLVEMYDAGIDVIVYVIGALTNAGFDIDPGFREIMRSNMSKFDPETGKAIKAGPNDPDGHPEGKVLKGPAYSPPNLHPIINDQFAFGHEDDTVYRTEKTPITLDGVKVGEGDIHMDHNGNVTMQGVLFDLDILPGIEAMSILDTYSEAVEPEVLQTYEPAPPLPESWPVPINIDEISPSEMYEEAVKNAGELIPRRIDSATMFDAALTAHGLVVEEGEQTIEVEERNPGFGGYAFDGPRRSTHIPFDVIIDSEEQDNS